METDGRGNAPQNIYEDNIRTESPYQTLQFQDPGKNKRTPGPNPTRKGSRTAVIILCTLSFLFLAIILVVVVLHYSQSCSLPLTPEPGFGLWHLRDNTFYLPWHGHGDCQAAETFCAQQNGSLAVPQHHNRDWMMSLVHGKQVWVNPGPMLNSGDMLWGDEEACSCELLLKAPDSPGGPDCSESHGWMCERVACPYQSSFCFRLT